MKKIQKFLQIFLEFGEEVPQPRWYRPKMSHQNQLLSYKELEEKQWIRSILYNYLEGGQWDKALTRIDPRAKCVINSGSMSEDEYNQYNQHYEHELPYELDYVDGSGCYPIHKAIMFGAPFEILKKIIQLRQDHLSRQHVYYKYPLHMICQKSHLEPANFFQTDKERARKIIWMTETYPQALLEQNEDDQATPLHIVLEHNPPLEVIKQMLESAPSKDAILKIRDAQGQVPLHIAMDYKADDEIQKRLIHEYPDATKLKMEDGYLPLHFAARFGCSLSILKRLLKHHPLAVADPSNNHDTPLHLVFDQFEEKFHINTRTSLDPKHADIEEMIQTMLTSYKKKLHRMYGKQEANKKMHQFFKARSSNEKTIARLSRNKVSKETQVYLEKVERGETIVKTDEEEHEQKQQKQETKSNTNTASTRSSRTLYSSTISPSQESDENLTSEDSEDESSDDYDDDDDSSYFPNCSQSSSFNRKSRTRRTSKRKKSGVKQEQENSKPTKKSRASKQAKIHVSDPSDNDELCGFSDSWQRDLNNTEDDDPVDVGVELVDVEPVHVETFDNYKRSHETSHSTFINLCDSDADSNQNNDDLEHQSDLDTQPDMGEEGSDHFVTV